MSLPLKAKFAAAFALLGGLLFLSTLGAVVALTAANPHKAAK